MKIVNLFDPAFIASSAASAAFFELSSAVVAPDEDNTVVSAGSLLTGSWRIMRWLDPGNAGVLDLDVVVGSDDAAGQEFFLVISGAGGAGAATPAGAGGGGGGGGGDGGAGGAGGLGNAGQLILAYQVA